MLPGMDTMFSMIDKAMKDEDKNLSIEEKEMIKKLKEVMTKIADTDENDIQTSASKDLMRIVKEFEKEVKDI